MRIAILALALGAMATTGVPAAATSPGAGWPATLSRLAAAQNANDAARVAASYAPDAVLTLTGVPEVHGRDGIRVATREWFAAFRVDRFGFARTWRHGRVVIAEWGMTGSHRGTYLGVPATGRTVGQLGISVLWFDRHGRITREHRYHDRGTLMAQIGAVPFPARPPLTELPPSSSVTATGRHGEDRWVDLVSGTYPAFERMAREPGSAAARAAFAAAIHPDIVHEVNDFPEAIVGREAEVDKVAEYTRAFPDLDLEIERVWGFGDTVIVEGRSSGTHLNEFAGVPPTHRAVSVRSVDIFQVRGHRIARAWTYEDGWDMATQLGLV